MTGNRQYEWSPERAELIGWFQLNVGRLPRGPFVFVPGVTVEDPEVLYRSLAMDIAAGPAGARARHGILQNDLRRLQTLFATPPATSQETSEARTREPGKLFD